MYIGKFMTPADKLTACFPKDPLEKALDLLIDSSLGAVVVLHQTGDKHIPVGIITKSDLLRAYKAGLTLDHKVEEIMSRYIETLYETDTEDSAAKHFERTKHHHAFVVNKDEQFVGLVTTWDVATEVARDSRAWPWNRESIAAIEAHARRSPATRKKVAEAPKDPAKIEPHSFLGIAGATE